MLEAFHDQGFMNECLYQSSSLQQALIVTLVKIKLITLNPLYSEKPTTPWGKEKASLKAKLFHNSLLFLF